MNDAKTKLGRVKPYSYDADGFKLQLKGRLLQEYAVKYGIEEDFSAQVPEKKSFFSFKRLALTPVMAVLVLAVFISYEYIKQPMTAYAYLKKVEKRNKRLKNGFKVNAVHTIDGYTLSVNMRKDDSGDLHLRVLEGNDEVESLVMQDGVLYVKKEELEPKRDQTVEFTSLINSLVLAEISDPLDELRDLMEREDVEFSEDKDGLVKLSYEENLDGDIFVNELYFKDYTPVRRTRAPKLSDVTFNAEVDVRGKVETIEYREIEAVSDEIEKPADYVVFVENDKFNEKISEFVDTEVDDLAREYSALPDKEAYFVWNKEGIILPDNPAESPLDVHLTAPDEIELPEEAAVPSLTEDVKLPKTEEKPDESSNVVESGADVLTLPEIDGMIELKMPDTVVSPPLKRDVYLEEVFRDLLEEKQPEDGVDFREVPDPVIDGVSQPESTVLNPDTVKKELPKTEKPADIPAPQVRDFSKIELPKIETEKIIDMKIDLVDHSVPEPYMAEPMDSPVDPPADEKSRSHTDLVKERDALQQDLANRRLKLRMQEQTENLNRAVEPEEPVSEFKKAP